MPNNDKTLPSAQIAVTTPDGVLTAKACQNNDKCGIEICLTRLDESVVPLVTTEYTPGGEPTCRDTEFVSYLNSEELRRQDREVPPQRRERNTKEPNPPWFRQDIVTAGLVTNIYPDGALLAGGPDSNKRVRVFHYNYRENYGPEARAFFYLLDIIQKAKAHPVQARIIHVHEHYSAVIEDVTSADDRWLQGTVILSTKKCGDAPIANKDLIAAYTGHVVNIVPFYRTVNNKPAQLVNITIQTDELLENNYHGVIYMVDTPPGVAVTDDAKTTDT